MYKYESEERNDRYELIDTYIHTYIHTYFLVKFQIKFQPISTSQVY